LIIFYGPEKIKLFFLTAYKQTFEGTWYFCSI